MVGERVGGAGWLADEMLIVECYDRRHESRALRARHGPALRRPGAVDVTLSPCT
jgi:hypothetical protein